MVRYHIEGEASEVDATFTSPFGESFRPDRLAIESDGSILVAGYTYSGTSADLAVAHYTANCVLEIPLAPAATAGPRPASTA